jgi:ribose/xylose/arabinose/galactoside ABC-type transport system permease subunit
MVNVPGIWIGLLILFAVSVILQPGMFSVGHIANLLQIAAFLGVVALGQTCVILTGGIDLSVSGLIMMTNILACYLINGNPANIPITLAVCVLAGLGAGCLNGFLITKLKVIPLICTLAIDQVLYGLALIFTTGVPKGSVGEAFSVVSTGRLFSLVPLSFLIWLGITLFFAGVLKKTAFGRRLYAVGANSKAAWAAGIRTDRVILGAYIVSALTAVATGLLISAYVNIPSFGVGAPYALNSVAAVVVGGALLTGGAGSVISTAAGVLFIKQLDSLTNVMNVSTGGQYLIQAIIIIAGVAATRLDKKNKKRRKRECREKEFA